MIYHQYSNAPKIQLFLTQISALLKISIDDFYNNYFNIDTANTEGLINWGKILDQNNSALIPDYTYSFGFGDIIGLPPVPEYPQNFDNSLGFWEGRSILGTLTDDQYRLILKLKYRILTTNNSYRDINSILNNFVYFVNPSYKFRIIEISPMHIDYQFNFSFLGDDLIFYYLITEQLLFPRPSGVAYTITFNQPF